MTGESNGMKTWLKISCAFFVISGIILGGCGPEPAAPGHSATEAGPADSILGFPVTVENYNSQGQRVSTVYEKPPERIIALWQNSAETLIELGAEDDIIAVSGIDDESQLAPENRAVYKTLPVLSKQILNQETAASLQPDFILGWLFDFTGKANSVGTWNYWHQRKVPVYMTMMNNADFLQSHTVEDELKYVDDVGKITGRQKKAGDIIQLIQNELNIDTAYGKEQAEKHGEKQKVLIIGSLVKDLHIYTPRTLPGNIVGRLGGTVLGREAESVGHAEIMSYESVVDENPDVIFIQSKSEKDQEGLDAVYRHEALQNVNAVKNHRVYAVPFYTIRCPAVRVRDAIDIFARGLYPGMNSSY